MARAEKSVSRVGRAESNPAMSSMPGSAGSAMVKSVAVKPTTTDFTIADPADPGMLDIAGFDAALPTLLTDFSARAI